MKAYDHTHKYERTRLGSFKKSGHEIYKCMVPGCGHYVIDVKLVVAAFSQCWGVLPNLEPCPNEVEMTRYLVFNEKRKRPLCEDCKERRRQEREAKKEEKTEQKLNARIETIERLMQDAEIYDEQ